MIQTKKYTLTNENIKKIITGAAIALGGALITIFAEQINQIDFGEWTPVVTALSAILINAARQYLSEK